MGLTHWKWVPLKVMRHTLVSSNKRVSFRESVEKRVSLALLEDKYIKKKTKTYKNLGTYDMTLVQSI